MKFCFRRSQRLGKCLQLIFFLSNFIDHSFASLQNKNFSFFEFTSNAFLNFKLISSFSSVSVCGPPAVPVNAKVQTKTSDGLIEARYDCDSGYELFGPATIRCDPHKGWEKELPFCGKHLINQQSRGFDILDAHQNGNLQTKHFCLTLE